MTDETNETNIPAWVQLYLARRSPPPTERKRPTGRPRRSIPRDNRTTFELTDGELKEIQSWQKLLGNILNKKLSYGETAGILAHMCSERYDILALDDLDIQSLEALVSLMVHRE